MKYSSYVAKYNGTYIDWDKMYGVQCVDLIDHYIENCLGIKVGYYGNARTWVDNYKKSIFLQKYFTLIKCTFKDNEVKLGDIGVRCSGEYGHIFIIDSQNKNKIIMYDENANGKHTPMTKRVVDYNSKNITHILRPKDRRNLDAKVNKPKVKVGDYVTYIDTRTCYQEPTSKKGKWRVCDLTYYGSKDTATRVKGAKHKIEKIKEVNGSIWIAYTLRQHLVYNCIYDYLTDKSHIK